MLDGSSSDAHRDGMGLLDRQLQWSERVDQTNPPWQPHQLLGSARRRQKQGPASALNGAEVDAGRQLSETDITLAISCHLLQRTTLAAQRGLPPEQRNRQWLMNQHLFHALYNDWPQHGSTGDAPASTPADPASPATVGNGAGPGGRRRAALQQRSGSPLHMCPDTRLVQSGPKYHQHTSAT